MSFIDSLVGAFSPRAAYYRMSWRRELEELRSYDAGNGNRLNANWRAFNESAESSDRWNRDTIRARARDLERNSDIAQSVILAYRRNVVGNGFSLQAKTNDTVLNTQIEKLWKVWCKAQNCDVTGTQSFNQLLRMAVTRKRVDGGILFLKRYSGSWKIPFQLQAIEVDELDTTQVTPKSQGNKVVGGIEYDPYNKAVGYYIRQYDIEGYQIQDAIYVQAKDVIFYFSKHRPSQIREMSDLTPTMTRIRDINEFVTAVSVKERIAACLAVFIKKITPSGGGLGRSNNVSQATGDKFDYNGKRLAPGMISELNPGEEVDVVDPKSAGSDASAFLKLQNGLIGAGQGLSYEAVSRDMSMTNYSSARQGMIEDELTYGEELELLTEKVMNEVYESFIIAGFLAGVFDMPGFWNKKDEYFAHEWVSVPKKWIDPLKESNANKTALASGQKTFKQIAAENGKDWKDMLDEMAEINGYAGSLGIDLSSIIFGKPVSGGNGNTDYQE